jgi:hypothetical protein
VIFYLGVHHPIWLATAGVELFVSHRRLADRRTFPRAIAPWVCDSGGFSQLSTPPHCYTETPAAYAAAVRRYAEEVGSLAWCAPQDFMCEPFMVARTGLSTDEHIARTVGNYLDLAEHLGDMVMPVIQGWTLADYHRCIDRYEAAGVHLTRAGIGSVCRRQNTHTITTIVASIHTRVGDLHAFGVSGRGLGRFAPHLASADSMAWSQLARRDRHPMIAGHTHRRCSNCLPWALRWRERTIRAAAVRQLTLF